MSRCGNTNLTASVSKDLPIACFSCIIEYLRNKPCKMLLIPNFIVILWIFVNKPSKKVYSEPCQISHMNFFMKLVFWGSCPDYASVRNKSRFTTQLEITCSKLTIETLEKGVKYVKS